MEIFFNTIKKLNTRTAVALGQFDAMHIGHTEILRKTVEYAKDNNMKSLVFLFENDPLEVISGKKSKNVNSLSKRIEILRALGVDIVFVKKLDNDFMKLSYIDFIDSYLVDAFNAGFVAAGFNYRFGTGAEGNTEKLTRECASRGIETVVVQEVIYNGKTVSSTEIRNEISAGNVDKAAKLMGRYYSISGIIKEGNKLGRSVIGFPTANIEIPHDRVLPKLGVYIAVATLDGKKYTAICNIGEKPSVENNYPCIETHIDGDFGELYGKEIEVEFCKFIREISCFDSLEKLAGQLAADKTAAREYFKNYIEK